MAPDASAPRLVERSREETEALAEDVLCVPYVDAVCGGLEACGCDLADEPPDVCRARALARCAEQLVGRFLSVHEVGSDGALLVDEPMLEACAETIGGALARCDTYFDLQSGPCLAAIVSAAPLGGVCSVDTGRCAGGEGFCWAGRCERAPRPGEPCELGCQWPALCVDGRCAARGEIGASCRGEWECREQLRCIEGACAAAPELGAACDDDGDCGFGQACVGRECFRLPSACTGVIGECGNERYCPVEPSPVCAPLGVADAPCTRDSDCVEPLACSVSGRCAPPPEVGAACFVRCAPGLYCESVGGGSRCMAPRAPGEACDGSPPRCAGSRCESGVCGEPPGAGDECTADLRCPAGLVCGSSGECIAASGEGGACSDERDCRADLGCREGVCGERSGEGEPCTVASCAPGLECQRGLCVLAPAEGEPCVYECRAAGLACRTFPVPATPCVVPACDLATDS